MKSNVEIFAQIGDVLRDEIEFFVTVDDDEIGLKTRALLACLVPRTANGEFPIARRGEVLPSQRTLS